MIWKLLPSAARLITVKKPLALLLFGCGKRRDPFFDFFFRRVIRIEAGVLRFCRRAENERLVFIESRPRSFVDDEVMQAGPGLPSSDPAKDRAASRHCPLQTWRRKMPSMIFEASTSLARTRRSLGESFEMSAVISVGAKRAVICSICAVSELLALFSAGAANAESSAARRISERRSFMFMDETESQSKLSGEQVRTPLFYFLVFVLR